MADTPAADPALDQRLRAIESRLKDLQVTLSGDAVRARRGEPTPPSIVDCINQIVYEHWFSSADATATHRHSYEIAAHQFGTLLAKLRSLILVYLTKLEVEADAAGASWTPGRVPDWES